MPDSGSSAGPSPKPRAEILAFAREALQREAEAIQGLIPRLGEEFVEAVQRIAETRGRVILSGLGKSGLVAKKVAATMASLGIPAFFLHAAEAFHGDMGVLQEGDLLIVFSKSGETKEVLELVQLVRTRDVPVLAITGNRHSTLARYSDLVLHAAVGARFKWSASRPPRARSRSSHSAMLWRLRWPGCAASRSPTSRSCIPRAPSEESSC